MMQHYIRMLSILFVIALALFTWWRLGPERRPFFKVLGALMVIAFVVESIGFYTTTQQIANADMYNVYILAESWAVLYLIYLVNPKWKFVLAITAFIALSFMILAYSNSQLTGVFLHTEAVLGIFLMLTLLCLAVLIRTAITSEEMLHRIPEFWVFMGFLIYFGGAAPILAVLRHLNDHDLELINQLRFVIIPAVCAVRYLMTAVGCTLELRNERL